MNNLIKTILEESGWHKNRKIDIDYITEEIQKVGLVMPSSIILEFLSEFGNLNIKLDPIYNEKGNIKIILEDIVDFLDDHDAIKYLSKLAKEDLFYIGTLFEETSSLFISSSGRFFMGTEKKFYLIGADFLSFMDNIIYQKNIIDISAGS